MSVCLCVSVFVCGCMQSCNYLSCAVCSLQDMDLYNEKTKYFGISELLESTHTGAGLPLLRFDSSFENMASAVEER